MPCDDPSRTPRTTAEDAVHLHGRKGRRRENGCRGGARGPLGFPRGERPGRVLETGPLPGEPVRPEPFRREGHRGEGGEKHVWGRGGNDRGRGTGTPFGSK